MARDPADRLMAESEHDDPVIGDTPLSCLFETSAERHAGRKAQLYKGGVHDRSLVPAVIPPAPDGAYASLSYAEMQSIVRALAAGFRELGVDAGTRVGIFSNTRMEWAQVDLALLAAGGVVTTVYTDSSPQRVRFLLDDAGVEAVVVEDEVLLDQLLAVESELDLSVIVCIDDVDGFEDREDVHALSAVHARGVDAFDETAHESRLDDQDLDDLASLIYTSGTTGQPKGVRLTHGNFRANVNALRKRVGDRPDTPAGTPTLDETDRVLSFLPLAHVFERLAGHFLVFGTGATVAYAESPDTIDEDFRMVGPTTAVSVPRVYERIHDALHSKMPRPVFERAVSVARQWSRTDDPGLSLRLKHAIVDRFVHASVRDKLGGNVTFLVSGGGSLSTEIVELFDGMGIPILEGYGLTETSPVVSVNPPEDYRPGTLGPPLSNVDVRLDESAVSEERREAAEGPIGELHVSGPSVSEGYWNRPRQTDAAFTEDGWFRTGDIIGLTDDGYLIYHDRLKQLLVLDTGKNVAPQPIENTLVAADPIEQAMVIGDGRRFVAALLVPNFQAVEQWAESERLDLPENREAICEDERVHEHVGQAVEAINETLSAHERIKAFRLVPIEWTAREDLMTPSMKMNRHNIRERFDEEIEAIYADTDP